MRPALLLSILIYGLILAGLATLHGALLALALPLVVYLAAGLLDQPEQPRLSATRNLSADRVASDVPILVRVSIANRSARLAEVLLEDRVPAALTVIEGTPRLLTTIAPGATVELAYTVSARRGIYRFAGLRAIAHDRLGLISRRTFIAAPGQLVVVPEVLKLRRMAIRPRRTQIYAGSIPARQGGPGVEFFGVREYQSGDPTRWINGRASARHPEALFVNEFEQERVTEVGIILDVRWHSDVLTAHGSLLEYGVQAAAALASELLGQGNRVGLLLYGNVLDWTFPGYGKIQRERILRALARAELGDAPAFEELDRIPTRLFPARAQLVLVSPLIPRDRDVLVRLRARRYELLVISPDPVAFEHAALGAERSVALGARVARLERTVLLRGLRQAGIRVVDWNVEQPFHRVAAVAFSRAPRWSGSMGGPR
jgi:uncharacterized protein (DUF58 family)